MNGCVLFIDGDWASECRRAVAFYPRDQTRTSVAKAVLVGGLDELICDILYQWLRATPDQSCFLVSMRLWPMGLWVVEDYHQGRKATIQRSLILFLRCYVYRVRGSRKVGLHFQGSPMNVTISTLAATVYRYGWTSGQQHHRAGEVASTPQFIRPIGTGAWIRRQGWHISSRGDLRQPCGPFQGSTGVVGAVTAPVSERTLDAVG